MTELIEEIIKATEDHLGKEVKPWELQENH